MIRLVLVPSRAGLRGPTYAATAPDGRVLCTSREPFFEGARALLAEGVEPDTLLEAMHQGSAIVALRGVLGEVALWTIGERSRGWLRRQRWTPYQKPGAADA